MAKIFVADDEETIVRMVRRVLESAGHEVKTVSNGLEAIKLAAAEDFDLYLIDVRMPRLDGYSLSNSITKQFPERKVVLITGVEKESYELMVKTCRASAVLEKPFDGPQLLEKIKEFLP
jgi:CheY-like chemotaxis protein